MFGKGSTAKCRGTIQEGNLAQLLVRNRESILEAMVPKRAKQMQKHKHSEGDTARDTAGQTLQGTHQGKHNEGRGKASATREGRRDEGRGGGRSKGTAWQKGTPSVVKLTRKDK